jgi:hypothetical protein
MEPKLEQINLRDSSLNSLPWLGNIFPNPFSDVTNVPYFIPLNCSNAEIEIFDVLGNRMDVYPLNIKGVQATLKIGSKGYSGGVYFCILIVDRSEAGWKKLLIIK